MKKNNSLELVFKNAIHLTNKVHWELANNPNKRERASFLKENFSLIHEKKQIKFITEGLIFDKIDVRFFHGHTASQMIPIINYKNKVDMEFLKDFIETKEDIKVSDFTDYSFINKCEQIILLIDSGTYTFREIEIINKYISFSKEKVVGWFFIKD